jgi:hypothetical protein
LPSANSFPAAGSGIPHNPEILMDWSQIAGLVLAAVVSTAVPILLPRALTLLAANIHNKDVALIADVAARAAGRIALEIAQARASNPGMPIASIVTAQLAQEQAVVLAMVPETVAKLGVPPDTIGRMIQGELGKLLAPQPGVPAVVIDPRPAA